MIIGGYILRGAFALQHFRTLEVRYVVLGVRYLTPTYALGNHVLIFGSALLMLSIVIGVYPWRPPHGKWLATLSLKQKAIEERFSYDLHKTFGIVSGLLLMVCLFIGLLI